MIEQRGTIIVISGVASGAGKTTLATAVIEYLKDRVRTGAAKITVTHGEQGCPHGGKSCNVCTSLGGDFQIISRTDIIGQKGTDTAQFASAGAEPVVWGITRDVAIGAMWDQMADSFRSCRCVVIESNTLALTIKPTVNLMIVDPTVSRRLWKQSALALISSADLVVFNNRGGLDARESTLEELQRLRGHREIMFVEHPCSASEDLLFRSCLDSAI